MDEIKRQAKTALSTNVDAIKTGMLSTEDIIEAAGKIIEESGVTSIVIDPVMVCKGEDEVLNPGTVDSMITHLLPRALVVTPNLFEAGQLSGLGILKSIEDMKAAAEKFMSLGRKT